VLRYYYITILLFSFFNTIAQQDYRDKFKFIHYTIEQGLSQASINDIILDDSGYLWIATQDGLNRFDGTSFLAFYNNKKMQSGLCGNFINTLLLDNNRIWIGTRSSGLCYYDIKKNSFSHFPELTNNDIITLKKDRFGNIYATLDNNNIAIIKNDNSTKKYKIIQLTLDDKPDVSTTALYISPDGTVWVGTKEGDLYHAHTNRDPTFVTFNKYSIEGDEIGNINVINSNNPDEIWVGTRQALYRLNVKNRKISKYRLSPQSNSTPLIIYDIKWRTQEMWVATGDGLYVVNSYNSENKTITQLHHKGLNSNSLSNNTVTKIIFDNENQGWIGTGKFLNLIYKDPIVNIIKSEAGNKNSLNSNVVFSIKKYGDNLCVGTSGGGLNMIKNGKLYTFTGKSAHLLSNVVFSTATDKSGNIWVGTKEGLSILSDSSRLPKNMTIKNITHNPSNNSSLSNNFIRQVYRDRDSDMWICTYNGGLNRFTGSVQEQSFKFMSYKHENNNPASIPSDRVYCIRQSGENEYWVGTIRGVAILSFKNGEPDKPEFKRLTVNNTPALTDNVVYDILVAKDRNLWIGTRNGLFFYNRKNSSLEHFNSENGMPNSVVYGILEDDRGRIWASTNNGIACLNTQTKQFTNYNSDDGFADKEFNLQAQFKDEKGMLYFGGINGISFFNPERMKELNKKNRLYFNGLQVTNYKTNQLEKFVIEKGKNVELHSNQFPFYVNFSNINLLYHKNTNFAYRLIPVDKKWNFIGKKRQIQFLNLAPGKYTLEIQGVSRNSVWERVEPLSLPISIIPPWWKSDLAYIIYIIIFLTFIYTIYKFNLNKNLEHQERLRLTEIDELKTTFYTNITHELRTPLTVILGVTEDIRENLNENESAKYSTRLKVLMRNSKKLLQLINQVLDLSKIENSKLSIKATCDDIVHFLKVITESFHSLAAHKNIEFAYYNEIDNLCMDFDREKFSIVISNLLNNAIKFTPEYGKIILHVKDEKMNSGKDNLIIKVKDSGIGIAPDDLNKIFDRFFQAKNSTKKNIEGTGIGLAIVKEYIGLMQGNIGVESNEGKGTVFTIRIPVSKKAKRDKASFKTEEEVPASTNEKPDKPIDINKHLLLIVEDNYDVANYVASCIEPEYQIIFARDGEEGIEMAIKSVPDIIITDLMMPKKDGFKLCEILKNDTATSHIPIIMLTARSLEQDKLKGYSAGADAYLIKPFNKKELIVRIEQLTELRKNLQKKYSSQNRSIIKVETAEDKFLSKIFLLIDKNLDNAAYKSSNLAADLNLSESQMYRKIKALTNRSTAILIRDYRLEKAKEMLTNTRMNISEIAYICGFNDPAWFTHAFKQKYNKAPSCFKK